MTKIVSIEEANPFKEETAFYSPSDIKRINTKVEFKSEDRLIVALPNGETILLNDAKSDEYCMLKPGDTITIISDPDDNIYCDDSKYSKLSLILPEIQLGKIFRGNIIDTKNQGLIVDIDGLEAFMPQAQIDYQVDKDLHTYIGTKIDVKFICVKLKTLDKNRFLPIVSHKVILDERNSSNAQIQISKLHIGDIISGIVKNIANYGVFVTLFPTVDGLIHITDLSWKRVSNPSELLSIGQEIDVMILDIKELKDKTQRISLGLKQLTPKPWEYLDKGTKEGDLVTGTICNIMDYGIFVMLPCGVEGLVHKTELSWDDNICPRDYQKGQEITAKVITIDWESEKLLLSIKQLDESPWTTIDEYFSVGDRVKATITSFTSFGIIVSIGHGIKGMIHVSELSWIEKIKKPKKRYNIGDNIDVVILSIDKEQKKIELSYKRLFPNPWVSLKENEFVDVIVDYMNDNGVYAKLANTHLPAFLPANSIPDTLICQEKQVLHCTINTIDEKNKIVIVAIKEYEI